MSCLDLTCLVLICLDLCYLSIQPTNTSPCLLWCGVREDGALENCPPFPYPKPKHRPRPRRRARCSCHCRSPRRHHRCFCSCFCSCFCKSCCHPFRRRRRSVAAAWRFVPERWASSRPLLWLREAETNPGQRGCVCVCFCVRPIRKPDRSPRGSCCGETTTLAAMTMTTT